MKKALFLLIFAILVILILVTGLYSVLSIIFCVSAQTVDNFGQYLAILTSGVVSGIVCYLLHKITF